MTIQEAEHQIVTAFDIHAGRPADVTLWTPALDRHQTIFGRAPLGCSRGLSLVKMWAAARPSFNAVSAVTGSTFATPRTPSVPKIFFAGVTSLIQRPVATSVNGKLLFCSGGL